MKIKFILLVSVLVLAGAFVTLEKNPHATPSGNQPERITGPVSAKELPRSDTREDVSRAAPREIVPEDLSAEEVDAQLAAADQLLEREHWADRLNGGKASETDYAKVQRILRLRNRLLTRKLDLAGL